MRIMPAFMSVWCALLLHAQPDTMIWSAPCSFPAPHALDLNGDSIMDINVSGHVVGTDDEPSSSGHCTWGVHCLAGTMILHDNDRYGPREPHTFTKEGVLGADDLRNAIRTQQQAWAPGMIPVVQWGYGAA